MDEHAWLAERFEEHRTRLRAVAYRMLGSLAEADEAVQDAWLRVSRLGAGEIDNLSSQSKPRLRANRIEGPQTTEDPIRTVSKGDSPKYVLQDERLVSIRLGVAGC
jgi:DNA-directed RNA polymerase specialized sigma24 family protein